MKRQCSAHGQVAVLALMLSTQQIDRAPAAECKFTPNAEFALAAREQFGCSSTRPLKDPPAGEEEFQVKLDFPASEPVTVGLPWIHIDFQKDPDAYLRALLKYGIEHNAEPAVDWRIEKNRRSSWCHAPWWHGKRERLHGMTAERGSRVRELHKEQKTKAVNWAIGFYNDVACYALGEVWRDPSFPKTKGFHFPVGSYSIKLLFTTASTKEVPYLENSKIWNAAINNDGTSVAMRLLQVDVAARDARADAYTGWVFGTFIYNANSPGQTVWDRLVPVGLQWGSDPDLIAGDYEENGREISEAYVNPKVARMFIHLPRHNLGLFGRLNGPVDNPKAGCLGCHSRALDWGRGILPETKQLEEANGLIPFAPAPYNNEAVRTYFRNLKPDEAKVTGTQSLDYSLQLAGGIAEFRMWVLQNYKDKEPESSDVPPYKFKADDPTAGDDLQSYIDKLLKNSSATIDLHGTSFVRGEQ